MWILNPICEGIFDEQTINVAVHQSVFGDSVTTLRVYRWVQLYRCLSDPHINISIAQMVLNCFHGVLHKSFFFSPRSWPTDCPECYIEMYNTTFFENENYLSTRCILCVYIIVRSIKISHSADLFPCYALHQCLLSRLCILRGLCVCFGLTNLPVSTAVELIALDKTWTCSDLESFSYKSAPHYLLCTSIFISHQRHGQKCLEWTRSKRFRGKLFIVYCIKHSSA